MFKNNRIVSFLSDEKNKHILLYMMSFLVPFFITLCVFAALGITPFGSKTLVMSDADSQYINYYSYFKSLLSGDHSFLYSFSKSIGGSLIGLVAYYLINPLLVLFEFSNIENIPIVFTWISLLSSCLCGVTSFILLSHLFGKKFSNLIFSTSYSLMAYNVVYSFNLIFLTHVVLLPLVILGIYKIIRKQSPLLYIITIALSVLMNFYMGYIMCVASLLFFIVYLFIYTAKEDRKRIAITYGISSLIGGVLSSFIWIPTLLSLLGGRVDQTRPWDFNFTDKFPLIQLFSKLFSGTDTPSQMVDGLPNIFCGILVVFLVILFFTNKEIALKKKRGYALLSGIYLISFYIIAFTSIFHGFTHTVWFPFRYSFVFSMILILMAAEQFQYVDMTSILETKKAWAILIVSMLIVFATQYEYISGGLLLLDLLILFVMWFGFWLYKTNPEKSKQVTLSLLLLFCCSLNLYFNYYFSIKHMKKWEFNYDNYAWTVMMTQPIIDFVEENDSGFYRMENEEQRAGNSGNDPFLYGYNGVGSSSSAFKHDVVQGLAKLGINWYDMRNSYDEGIAASMDSLLGIKYVLSKRDLSEEKNYQLYQQSLTQNVYMNPYALPIAIVANSDVNDLYLTDNWNVFDIQNQIWKAMTGETENLYAEEKDVVFRTHNLTDPVIMTKDDANSQRVELDRIINQADNSDIGIPSDDYDDKNTEFQPYIEFSFTAKNDGPIYIYYESELNVLSGTQDDVLRYLGYYSKGDEVIGRAYFNQQITNVSLILLASKAHIAYADMNVLADYSSLLNSRDSSIVKEKDTLLSGSFTADTNQSLLFTIPYDEGWTLYVDGKETPLEKTIDFLMSANVDVGTHTYVMKFFPKGMKLGIIISSVALIALIAWLCYVLISKKKDSVQNSI